MKNRKKKLCPHCFGILKHEKDKYLRREFPLVCTTCNENFYSFEAKKTTKKSKIRRYK